MCAPTPPALVILKSNPVVVGTTATYTVTVTNTGGAGTYALTDSPLFGAGITVTAPPVCTNTSVLPGVGDTTPTCTTTTGPWALADPGTAIAAAVAVPVVDSYTVAIPFAVDSITSTTQSRTCPAAGSFTASGLNNGATLTAAGGVTSSDPGCGDAPPPLTFSFSITKTPSVGTVTPGAPLSFTVVVTNNGPAAADGASITDPAIPFYTANAVSCLGMTGGATCPTPLTVAAMQGSG
ncbi:MAG: DUF11 domain-containing protein [Betaproteobacteria bacterium]|nr:DUF11 domain-containing protein [Betaproteobacteria bacterium]